MVDRYQVRDLLLGAGVSPDAFRIVGVHEPRPAPTDFWFLRPGPEGDWEVGLHERGVDDVRGDFDSEPAACDLLYRALTGRPVGR